MMPKNYFLLPSWRSLTKRAGSGAGSVSRSEDPDPYRTEMSQIRNTGPATNALKKLWNPPTSFTVQWGSGRTYRPHQFFWREFCILFFNFLARVMHSLCQLFWREFCILSFNSSGASFAVSFSTLLARVLHYLFQLFWCEFCILSYNFDRN